MTQTFKALLVEQHDGQTQATIRMLPKEMLPQGDVLVRVVYSSLNYKDGLAVTGQGRVIRNYPMAPGIDLAGIVEESENAEFKPGEPVIVTGYGIGENTWGGYAQLARVKSEWLVPLPEGMTLKQAMGIGTAGFTAMLAIMELEDRGMRPGGRAVVVTGAAGGLGSIAVAILAHLGYTVVASSGRTEAYDYLRSLGAQRILDRSVLSAPSNKPLESEHWGGAIDAVGGDTLAGLLRSMAIGTGVASCGLAGGSQLNTTVLPFILRGVALIGIDSVRCPQPRRRAAWQRLARDLPVDLLYQMMQVAPLEDVPALSREILRGKIRGRVVVDVNA